MEDLVRSPFDCNSTAQDVVARHDLRGRTFLVTGGAGGIGLEACRALHSAGGTVVVTARDEPRARQVLRDAGLDLEVLEMDLASLASIRAFAERWGGRAIDVLIANAGVMALSRTSTVDGFEAHIGVNHLAHFLLTLLLLPSLRKGNLKRVVVVASSAHRLGRWTAQDDLHFRDSEYDSHLAYARSKAANALFALAFDDRYAGEGIRAFSLMPGVILTPLMRHTSLSEQEQLFTRLARSVRTPQQGAATIVWAAIGEELANHGGLYLQDCAQAEMAGDEPGFGVAAHVRDRDTADRLWNWSLREVGWVDQGS